MNENQASEVVNKQKPVIKMISTLVKHIEWLTDRKPFKGRIDGEATLCRIYFETFKHYELFKSSIGAFNRLVIDDYCLIKTVDETNKSQSVMKDIP